MADEPQYSSDTNNNNSSKRKYDEQPLSGGRSRPTGFSSGPISPDSGAHAPPSYNTVPPPSDDITLYKQRAQEIAARLMSGGGAGAGAFDAKRPRVDNGGSGFDSEKGFSSAPSEMKPYSTPSAAVSYNSFQGSSKKIDIPNNRVGVIIGKGGETIKYLQMQSGSKIQVTRDMDADPGSTNRAVELVGTPEQIAKAEQLINDVLAEAEAGGSGNAPRRLTTGQPGSDHFSMKIPNNKVGLVIGKGGETIKNIQARTGARVQVIPLHLPPGDNSAERTVQIDGTSEQIDHAKQLVDEVISENRPRNQSMSGGYSQQGYQSRPPSSGYGAPQPGYGYMQPGSYPGPSPQPPYGGGYPQQPTSGGYASGWDQSTVPPAQQTTQAAGGYDYYGQQQQQTPTAPGDNSGYNYNNAPPASGYGQQGYTTQDGYGAYQGYGQQPSYDQQQGYGGYSAAATNPPQEGQNPNPTESGQAPAVQPGYGNSQQPSSNTASYPQSGYGVPPTSQSGGYQAPAAAQSGYGAPQGQKPSAAAYGQTQQSPGSYGQPGGYPTSQAPSSGYSQPAAATSAQPGYGAPSYATQPGYGQYGAASYGSGGYPQAPPAYSSDSNTAAPVVSQSGVTKASPQG